MIHLDAHYNVITGQIAECMECHSFFAGIPLGFIYNDPASGWYQDDDTPFIEGYCKPCATTLAALDHEDHVNGNWDRRTIEDEMYVWAR